MRSIRETFAREDRIIVLVALECITIELPDRLAVDFKRDARNRFGIRVQPLQEDVVYIDRCPREVRRDAANLLVVRMLDRVVPGSAPGQRRIDFVAAQAARACAPLLPVVRRRVVCELLSRCTVAVLVVDGPVDVAGEGEGNVEE